MPLIKVISLFPLTLKKRERIVVEIQRYVDVWRSRVEKLALNG